MDIHYKSVAAEERANAINYGPEFEHLDSLNILDQVVLDKGKDEMGKHKTVFCAICRDNALQIPVMIKYIEFIGSFFQEYSVIIFENDSTDGTKKLLQEWKKRNDRVNIIFEDFKIKKRPNIKFLADCRNRYIQELHQAKYSYFDMCIFLDMDMGYGIDIRGIMDSFAKIDIWDGVFANGIFTKSGRMYDAFAFRNTEFPFVPGMTPGYWKKNVFEIQKIYPPGSSLVPVDSAFGGVGIYKRSAIHDCLYDAPGQDCEHVDFHRQAREKNYARLFMNPSMVIRYIHYH